MNPSEVEFKSHTPEPWYVGSQNSTVFLVAGKPPAINDDYPARDANRTVITSISFNADILIEIRNAERIVACVNALTGILNPAEFMAELREVLGAVVHCDDEAKKELAKNGFELDPSITALTERIRRLLTNATK